MKIQITTSILLQQTPVFIEVPREKIPHGALQLRPMEGGVPVAAQANENGIFALLTLPSGTAQFELESAPPQLSNVTLHESAGQLKIELPGGAFGTYHFGETAPRPYIWPLYGPDGVELTRAFPMENREGEKHDHPHHRSLWTAFDEVNEVNNWHEGEGHGWTRHQRFLDQFSGPVFGGFTSESLWTSAQGKPVLTETRTVRAYNLEDDARLFDYEIGWHATHGDVTFGDTKEAGALAIRVATSMDGERGGVITNSNGGCGEKECWGKRADWCDYSGEVGGALYGITIFNRPESYGGAPRWHVRDYGLFATNPFSVAAFEGGENQPFVLKSGQSAHFSYRVLLHKGEASDKIKQMAESWKNPAEVTIEL